MDTVTKMRLSKETLAILKNFAGINSNILIKPGNKLRTMSPNANILAEAQITEDFDTEVPIWDLNQFLAVVSMFSNPDLEFNEKYVDISNGRSTIRYHYSDASLLTVPKRDIRIPDSVISFDLSESNLNEISKAANILQVTDLQIIAENGSLSVQVDDSKNDTSNKFSLLIDENYDGPDYTGSFNVSEIKFLPGSYKVCLTDTIISTFTHESNTLKYVIGTKRG